MLLSLGGLLVIVFRILDNFNLAKCFLMIWDRDLASKYTYFFINLLFYQRIMQYYYSYTRSKIMDPKIGSSRRHLLVGKRTILDYGLALFLKNKTFFCQDRQLKFSASVWFRISWNTIQLIQTTFIFIFSIGCLNELKFCEISRKKNQTDAKDFICLSWQTKKFYS